MYILGYIPKDNRLYLGDKELNVISYSLLLSVLEYQTAVMRQDFETADKVLPTVPREHRTRVAHFLEKQVQCNFVVISEKSPQYKSWGNLGSNLVFNYTEPKFTLYNDISKELFKLL